ncbi:MAG: DEAD/DEAH box helicase [Candidatus Methanofastidiosia archaeon]
MELNKWVSDINELENWVMNFLNLDELKKVNLIVNEKRIEKKFYNDSELDEEEIRLIKKILDAFEFATIDLWDYAFDEDNPEKKKALNIISREYFKICQILPIPEDDIEKIKYVLKLVTFSYMGEKWEDGRRFLIENEDILNVSHEKGEEWDKYIFKNIYDAIRYLIQKNSWKDLDKAVEHITQLKNEQSKFEDKYLKNTESQFKKGAALELASLYHLARTVELLATYMVQGTPTRDNILIELDFHFERAIQYCQNSSNMEFEILLHLLQAMFKKMVFNSIWGIASKINSRVTRFIEIVTKKDKPIFELLYPQRSAILDKGLLDPAHKAIVVNLPTSGGKTIIAEFRILQALNQFADEKGWVAYVVPTRALVNQMTARLRRDFSEDPLNIIVEKMSGALELDAFEETLIDSEDVAFDILVTTPEKLNLLIRQDIEENLKRPLALLIIDEAHNLEDKKRGLNLEMLLSTAKNDCKNANFLLLTPFVPNSKDIAKWLDPQNPKEISLEVRWKPNDRVLGMFYPVGSRRNWKTFFEPLVTSQDTIMLDNEILIGENEDYPYPISKLKTKYLLTSIVASQLKEKGNMLLIVTRIEHTYKIADILADRFSDVTPISEKVALVKRFVASELGDTFPLVRYLSKGIGIHHSGLPDEIRYLIEWLMEENLLKVLVATTTIAQGINFPVSTILMSSYAYPWTRAMPSRDFWNLAGRAGRMDQSSLGVIGIAVSEKNSEDELKTVKFVQEETQELTSVLAEMAEKALKTEEEFDLRMLASKAEWSTFLQYIAHMYRQSQNLKRFISELEITLRGTYGYYSSDNLIRKFLLQAVQKYAEQLDEKKHLATLSDRTGFSPESVQKTMGAINQLGISQSDWYSSRLFSGSSDVLRKMIGVMMTIPEIKRNLDIKIPGEKITHSTLSGLITEWVSGKEIVDITKEFWGQDDYISLSKCVSIIYSKITNAASWGVAAIQKLPVSGIDFDNLSEEDARKLKNIPAMIYYGVKTDDAVAMRMNNVPRSIAPKLGELYKREIGDIYLSKPRDIAKWLKDLDESTWGEIVPEKKEMSGKDYKEIWEKLSGIE